MSEIWNCIQLMSRLFIFKSTLLMNLVVNEFSGNMTRNICFSVAPCNMLRNLLWFQLFGK